MELKEEIHSLVGDEYNDYGEVAAPRPLPDSLRYLMFGLLVVGVIGVVTFGYFQQTSVKPLPQVGGADSCKDPITENRLRETLKQSPNDFASLYDWGSYNLDCEKNFPAAVAAYQQIVNLSQTNQTFQPAELEQARFRLGLAHLYNQNVKEAQAHFQALVDENPQNTSALLALSAAVARDNPAKAVEYLKKVIQLDPNSTVARQAQSLLEDLAKPGSTNRGTTATPTPKA